MYSKIIKIAFSILTVFFFTDFLVAQNLEKNNPEFKTFSEKEGLLIYHGALISDEDGWLWIYGQSLELAQNSTKGNDRISIIQRFDGNHFYTLSLPDFGEVYPNAISVTKKSNDSFFVLFGWENYSRLFTVNIKTLIFKEIILPQKELVKESVIQKYKDSFFLFTSSTKEINVYKYNILKEEFTNTYSKPNHFSNIGHFNVFIPFKNFFIVNESRTGAHIFSEEGHFLKIITLKDLDLENKKLKNVLNLETYFEFNSETYIKFNEIPFFYNYDAHKNLWTKSDVFLENKSVIKFLFKEKNQFIKLEREANYAKETTFKNNFTPINSFKIPTENLNKNILSRDLSKELFLLNEGVLYQYNLEESTIRTFLQDRSIRGILEIENNKLLVATDYSGFYIVDVQLQKVTPFLLTVDNENYIPGGVSKLHQNSKYYWASNDRGILKIDKKTGQTENFILYPVADVIQQNDSLFYSTFNYALMNFDKKTLQNNQLIETKEYDVQSFLKIQNTFYMACIEGLLIFKNNQLELIKPSDTSGDFEMISILEKNENTFYLGTRAGKLYEFNTVTKTFTLLFQDDLKASIATILIDDVGKIWLNTYKGFIAFHPKKKTYERFSIEEGFSFHEANRYSSLKTSTGYFAVGTLKGLNYFNPNNIQKNRLEATLKLTSITYFDKENNKEITEQAPQKLNTISTITLAPENRNVLLQFSIFGFFNKKDISYRYRLNANEPWIDLLDKTAIRIYNVAADTYQLEIQALDSSKDQIANSLFFTLIVTEFFYKTTWFYLFIFFFFLSIALWYYRVQQQKSKLQQQVTQDIINAQEEERTRLALELHDGVGQQLMLLTRKTKAISDTSLENLATNTLSNLRAISQGLHPVVLERFGFTAAIEDLINEADENSNTFFTLELIQIDDFISKKQALHLYRIFQEIINNMLKYADAKSAVIIIKKEENELTFIVEDTGKGFDYQKTITTSKSLGMKSLVERSKIIDAKLTINSILDKGTKITIEIPL